MIGKQNVISKTDRAAMYHLGYVTETLPGYATMQTRGAALSLLETTSRRRKGVVNELT